MDKRIKRLLSAVLPTWSSSSVSVRLLRMPLCEAWNTTVGSHHSLDLKEFWCPWPVCVLRCSKHFLASYSPNSPIVNATGRIGWAASLQVACLPVICHIFVFLQTVHPSCLNSQHFPKDQHVFTVLKIHQEYWVLRFRDSNSRSSAANIKHGCSFLECQVPRGWGLLVPWTSSQVISWLSDVLLVAN